MALQCAASAPAVARACGHSLSTNKCRWLLSSVAPPPLRSLTLVCCALLVAAAAAAAAAAGDPVIRTEKGFVRGVRHRLRDADVGGAVVVDEYLGIPYARPPVGELRFAAPDEDLPSWPGIRAATTRPCACWQPIDTEFGDFRGSTMWNADTEMAEDCLYLNVWTPVATTENASTPSATAQGDPRQESNSSSPASPDPKPLAVMVWIHGGGFFSGSAALDVYDGRRLAAAGNVVVVAINYRLGVLGFFALPGGGGSSRVAVSPNAGLLDQAAALGWVRRNAAAFGGDPGSVTLFGASAGAASVAYHLLSPISRPLFDRAILQTGTSLNGWASMSRQALRERNIALFSKLDCEGSDEAIVSCLREANPTSIVDAQLEVRPYVPVIDGVFLPESPRVAIAAGRFKRCPVLLGSNADEGSQVLAYMGEFSPSFNSSHLAVTVDGHILRNTLSRILSWYLPSSLVWNKTNIDAVVRRYRSRRNERGTVLRQRSRHCAFGSGGGDDDDDDLQDDDDDDSERNVRALIDAVSDVVYACAVADWARLHAAAAGASAYRYLFAHVSSQKAWGAWTGAMHGDETPYVFGEPLREPSEYTVAERQLSRHMIALWTGFARTGNPVSELSRLGYHWPAYSSTRKPVYELSLASLNGSVILEGPRESYCTFWKECFGQWRDNNVLPGDSQETVSLGILQSGSKKIAPVRFMCFAAMTVATGWRTFAASYLLYVYY